MVQKDIWKKSYLIEILSGDTLFDAFTFSLPPESEEFVQSQRKTETKTFGGLWVDDYGTDAVKINLSGTTGNREMKKIYRPGVRTGSDMFLTGEEEIAYIRDNIVNYKNRYKNDSGSLRMMLYDLSKISDSYKMESGAFSTGSNSWEVFLGDFKYSRTKDRPFVFTYSIEFTGIPYTKKSTQYAPARNEPEKIISTAERIKTNLDKLTESYLFAQGVLKTIQDAKAKVTAFVDEYNRYLSLINGIGDTWESITKEITGIRTFLLDQTQRVYDLSLNAWTGGIKNIGNSVNAIAAECVALWESPDTLPEQWKTNEQKYYDSTDLVLQELQDDFAYLTASSKSVDTPELIPVLDEDGNRSIEVVYGNFEVVVDSTMTLETIAQKYLGDSGLAILIAAYNGVSSITDLAPGDTIKIPVVLDKYYNSENLIYTPSEETDQLGKDIALSDKEIQVSVTGDFLLSSGTGNLSQAITMRLQENVDNRIKWSTYGIKNTIADPVASISYLIASINATVTDDPRVSNIENLRMKGIGDKISVAFDYTSASGKESYSGVV